MREINSEAVLKEFGQRAQRCFGCFVVYRLRDMYLGEDATFYCDYCKDDAMFHFNEFTKIIDLTKLREVAGAG